MRRNDESRGHAAPPYWDPPYWDGPHWHGFYWHAPYSLAPYWYDSPLVTCCHCGVILHCCPHGFMCNECLNNGAYGEKTKKKRKAKKQKNEKKSDEKTLEEREKEAKEMLMSLGVDYDSFDISTAIQMHQAEHTAEQRLALRASIAAKSIYAETDEEKKQQFQEFVHNMECALETFEDDKVKEWLRSTFLKAAHHRIEPWRHTSKNMQK